MKPKTTRRMYYMAVVNQKGRLEGFMSAKTKEYSKLGQRVELSTIKEVEQKIKENAEALGFKPYGELICSKTSRK